MSELSAKQPIHEKLNQKYEKMKDDIEMRVKKTKDTTEKHGETEEKTTTEEQIKEQNRKAEEQNRMVVEQITKLLQNLNDKNATEVAKIIVSLLIRAQIYEGRLRSVAEGLNRHDKALKVMFMDLEKLQKGKN